MKNIEIQKELWEMTEPERLHFPTFVQKFYKRTHKKDFLWNWHFDEIWDSFWNIVKEQKKTPVSERKTRILIFNVPPRSGKTEFFGKLIPVWLKGHFENLNFITSGYSYTLMKNISEQAKDYWNSDEFRFAFLNRKKLDYDSVQDWGHQNSGRYFPTGAGGTITGRGSDVFIIDDPLRPDDVARTGNELERINDWFGNTVFSRMNPDGLKIIVIIMQRLHDNDLCGFLLREYPEKFSSGEYLHLSIPAILENGESFFPERFSLEDLEQKRIMMNRTHGNHYFSAQYLQNPVDTENSEFKESMFLYFRNNAQKKFRQVWMGVDVAQSEKNQADWRSAVVVGQDGDGKFYVLENYYSRKNSSEVALDIFELQKKWKCDVIIEANGAQKYFSDSLRGMMQMKKQFFYLREISSRSDKNARLRSKLLPLYENGRIFHELFLQGGEMENEILRFPKSRHDDNMDALETAISAFSDFGESSKAEIGNVIVGNSSFFGEVENNEKKELLEKFFPNKFETEVESAFDWLY